MSNSPLVGTVERSSNAHFLKCLPTPCKTLECAILIILSMGSFAIAALGLGGYFQLGSLSNLSQIHAIVLMTAGAGGGIAFLVFGIVEIVKNTPKTKNEEHHIPPEAPKKVAAAAPPNSSETPFVFAPDGVNQYGEGGPAACTRIACRFLALTPDSPVCPEDIRNAIQGHGYKGSEFEETDTVIEQFSQQLKTLPNPWVDTQYTPEMQTNLYGHTPYGIQDALSHLFNDPKVNGAIMTGQMMTLGLRKQGGKIEIFDSHGSSELTGSKDNRAYVHRCGLEGAIEFLSRRFPKVEGMEYSDQYATIVFYPLSIEEPGPQSVCDSSPSRQI